MKDIIRWELNSFSELDTNSLYRIMHLRNRVFMLEQKVDCIDLDYKDQKASHLQGCVGEELAAYCRLFGQGVYMVDASIGRVAVAPEYRKKGYARMMMEQALLILGNVPITISAQLYLQKFYEEMGFMTVSNTYLEAGIPHIKMKKTSI